jgi:bifunctional non-homologous end joining protein LigD
MVCVLSRLSFIELQLPTLVDTPPVGKRWIHEIKHDGYRSQLVVEDGRVRVFTRNGFDWTDRYPSVVRAARALPCRSAIIDGEVVVQDERGLSDFHALRSAIRWQPERLILFAFDLMHLDGEDLRFRSLEERRERLRQLLAKAPQALQFTGEFNGDGAAFFKACAQHGLEGIVSKHLDSAYRSGRSKHWLKVKCFTESEFLVVGIDLDQKTRAPVALLADEEVNYAGASFIALSVEERERFFDEVERLACERSPIPGFRTKRTTWCRPELRVRVKHLSGSVTLRHATLRALV